MNRSLLAQASAHSDSSPKDRAANGSTDPPSVTVIVPSRGRPQLRARAVRSILSQRYRGSIECLVVFDGGDRLLPSVAVGPGRELNSIDNTRGAGLPAAARNSGALAARSELLAFCDDDDEWLADKLRHQVTALIRNEDVSAVSCGIEIAYRDRVVTRVANGRVTFDDLLRSRVAELHTSTLLVRRDDLLSRIGLFDEAIPGGYAEDYEWLLRAARTAPVLAVDKPLARIHWHDSSFYEGRWGTLISSLHYLLEKYPFRRNRKGLARIYGQLAFACAAANRPRESLIWSRRSIDLDWRQPRAYLSVPVAAGLLRPETPLRFLHRFGRGI
jgi:glycosyltransferase involved in cell wall biosynthesis